MILNKRYALLILALMLCIPQSYAQGPECCSRHAIFGECTYNDPMGMLFSKDIFYRSIRTRIAELMTSECFHFIVPEVIDDYWKREIESGNAILMIPNNYPEHEYSFDSDFISGLDEYTDEGRPIRSSLTVKMYFEGEQREFVHQWQTLGTWDTISDGGTSWLGHGQKLRHAYDEGSDIMEIMERFEKKPVSFQVIPEKRIVNSDEIIDIEISHFMDAYGNTSREFNRIVVHAYAGEILNGNECDIGPDYKVFKIGNGNITAKYKAPANCDEPTDRITIYSACDVLPIARVSLTKTQIFKRLEEKTLIINCEDAMLFLEKEVIKNTRSHIEQSYQTAPCQNDNKDDLEFNETVEGSVYITLESVGSFDMFAFNQRWETYEISDIRISGFRFNSTEKKTIYHQTSGINCAGSTLEQVQKWNRILTNRELDRNRWGGTVVVAFDTDSDEAVLILPIGVSIGYAYDEIYEMRATITGEDGTSTLSDSDTKRKSDALNIEAVEDEQTYSPSNPQSRQMQEYIESMTGDSTQLDIVPLVPPTQQRASQEKIHPDLIVQFGDGISYFGGSGQKNIHEEIEGGFSDEKRTFSWHMSRKQRKE